MKLDFITIAFNNSLELNLIKMQAISFKFIDRSLINKIYILYNDNLYFDKTVLYTELIDYYPTYLRDLVEIISLEDLNLSFTSSDWYSQQIVKICVSKYIKSDYYVVLDGKNHFIKNLSHDYFFNADNKPLLSLQRHGEAMLYFYNNCLKYFELPSESNEEAKVQTITPFVFIKSLCEELIDCIEEKEKISFSNFFINEKKYTEFFFYYLYLIYSEKNYLYGIDYSLRILSIGRADPKIHSYNSFKEKYKYILLEDRLCTFGLHRGAIQYMDYYERDSLRDYYIEIYGDNILSLLDNYIFNNDEKYLYFYENLPIDFQCDAYRSLNKDLINLNDHELKHHYSFQGIKENRLYK